MRANMQNILLIIPPTSITLDKDIGPAYLTPHIGLAYIAAFLKEKGYDVKIVDMEAEKLKSKDIIKKIKSAKPDIVGLTANTMQIKDASTIAKMIKKIDKSIPIIIGGYHATSVPKDTLAEFKYFDFVVYGEGEITIYELIKKIEEGKDVSSVKGIGYRKGNKIKLTKPRPLIKNLDVLPFPDFELFNLKKYRAHYNPNKKVLELPLSTSRGCPYQCIFCARPTGSLVRTRSISSVIQEIKRDVNEFDVAQIMFTDENFGLNKKRYLQLCDEIIKNNLNEKISWICESRVNVVDKELLQKMKKAGCTHIAYGVESGNEKILNNVNKFISLDQARNAVKWARESGIKSFTLFILGLPSETKETAIDTINFAIELDADFADFSILVPFPGTKIFEMAKKNEGGLNLLSCNWEKYGKHIGNALSLKNLSRRELEYLQIKGYMKFYLRPSKIRNLFTLINPMAIPIYFIHNVRNFVKSIFGEEK
jgi:radical SAM superfamily enzyme YgiQ (UPF0313 family)